MRYAILIFSLAALVPVAAVPAIAQQEAESGDVELEFSTTNAGDNSDVCAPSLQFANTGNLQNEKALTQDVSVADDIEFEAEEQMVFEPSLETACEQAVQQSASASSS